MPRIIYEMFYAYCSSELHWFEDVHGKTPLAAAAASNQLEATRCLVHARADTNAADYGRLTPLLWATQNGHLQVMRLLLEAKADKDATNERQETPLFLVATNGYATAVRVLTEAGADKERVDEHKYTPLSLAQEQQAQWPLPHFCFAFFWRFWRFKNKPVLALCVCVCVCVCVLWCCILWPNIAFWMLLVVHMFSL